MVSITYKSIYIYNWLRTIIIYFKLFHLKLFKVILCYVIINYALGYFKLFYFRPLTLT
jgi:hypothetical protein